MEISGTIQKQAWVDHTIPPVERVAPLVWSVPISFADNPIRYTFCYLVLNDAGDCVVIDPGWDSPEGEQQFTAALDAAGIGFDAVTGIVVTHLHADHLGMVKWVQERTGAWVAMHTIEAESLVESADVVALEIEEHAWFEKCGVPASVVPDLINDDDTYAYLHDLARPTTTLADGDLIDLPGRRLQVIFTPGHTAGHICVADLDSELMFTGDHVLPRVSPNVGLGALRVSRDALGDYYRSLDRMLEWDAYEVCPAHEYRFRGLAERSIALRDHHDERAEELVTVASGSVPLTLWEVAARLTWSRGWESLNGFSQRAALAETAAHLEHVVKLGRVSWEPASDDDPRYVVTVSA